MAKIEPPAHAPRIDPSRFVQPSASVGPDQDRHHAEDQRQVDGRHEAHRPAKESVATAESSRLAECDGKDDHQSDDQPFVNLRSRS